MVESKDEQSSRETKTQRFGAGYHDRVVQQVRGHHVEGPEDLDERGIFTQIDGDGGHARKPDPSRMRAPLNARFIQSATKSGQA
jgi:hypothetical protein